MTIKIDSKIVGYEVNKPHGFELLPKTDKGSDGPMAMTVWVPGGQMDGSANDKI